MCDTHTKIRRTLIVQSRILHPIPNDYTTSAKLLALHQCTILPNFSVIISLKNSSRRFKNCKRNSRNMADFQGGLASQNRVLKFGGKVLRFLAKRVALQVFWQHAIVTHVRIFDKVIFHTDWLFLYHKKVSHFYLLEKWSLLLSSLHDESNQYNWFSVTTILPEFSIIVSHDIKI